MDEDGLTFDEWFRREGYDEAHRPAFALAWNAALDSAKLDLDDEWHWLLDRLRG